MKRKIIKAMLPLVLGTSIILGLNNKDTYKPTAISASQSSKITYAFTQADQHPETLLKNVINSSKKTLDIAIYSLTKNDIVDSIIAAENRGVKVRLIVDHVQSKGAYEKDDIVKLLNAGIPIKENTHKGLMHLKVTIADNSVFTTGSYNYSKGATEDNDEVLLVIKDSKMAKEWETEFQRMWNDVKNFEDVQ